MNTIIRVQTILLDDQFASIKKTIENLSEFSNLLKICSFNTDKKSLTLKTEKIHPKYLKNNM